jgi:acetate kinase
VTTVKPVADNLRSLVLVLNAGSSSLKYRVVAPVGGDVVLSGTVERLEQRGHAAALQLVATEVRDTGRADELTVVGHRVVHGGRDFHEPTLVDDGVLARIDALAALAPLHNPPAAAGIRSAREAFPGLPQVAVFDTAFFHDLPPAAATYAIDDEVALAHQVRRYGFHGTSHAWVSRAAAELLGRDPDRPEGLRLVVLHLGNGASASAVLDGRPVDTSMGLTPLEGLVMGTRPGDVDPGVLLHLLRHGLTADDLERVLTKRSGLLGLTGRSDVRDVLAAVDAGDERARLGWEVYVHRLKKYVGAYVAVLGGADAVVFTAGVGEHSARARADVLSGLEGLGLVLDPARNDAEGTVARRVSTDASPVAVLVVPTDEELSIACQALDLVAGREATR